MRALNGRSLISCTPFGHGTVSCNPITVCLRRQQYQAQAVREGAWEGTGSLIAADGSEDRKIAPQGPDKWPGPHPPGFAISWEWLGDTDEDEEEEEGEVEELANAEFDSSDSDAE